MQNLPEVLQQYNFVIAERCRPGQYRAYSLFLYVRDVQQIRAMN